MKKATLYIAGLLMLIGYSSCKKDGFDGVTNSTPAVPVTFSDTYLMANFPVVSTSFTAGGKITFTLNIPASSGRTIKSLSRVVTVASGTAYDSIQNPKHWSYYDTPIAGNGTSVTYSTTLDEYVAKHKHLTSPVVSIPTEANRGSATAAYLTRYFYFSIILDNGQKIIPNAVRVYVNK